ncbi:MAG: 3-phosphoshikimate 1-carboxyvinyltransferase [Spirochaetaceae bacterium]|nr:3-phosphoshikimate 1-carboxyvinyltransferase [Spirochaetaceae bacterium]
METRVVYPGRVEGRVRAPASKSALQRAIACAALAEGVSMLGGVTLCNDALAALRVAEGLGARVQQPEPGSLGIEGGLRQIAGGAEGETLALSCGESGLCMRMYAPIAALGNRTVRLEAEGTLLKRPMQMVAEALAAFGATCASAPGGFPPLVVRGPLKAGHASIDAQGSSQTITGLLIALPLCRGDSVLEVRNAVSVGYLDLTRQVCARFGVHIDVEGEDEGAGCNSLGGTQHVRFHVAGGQRYRATSFDVEGDWSGAAFLAVAAAIAGTPRGLQIEGLDPASEQPDRAILEVLEAAGARVEWREGRCCVAPGALRPFEFEAINCPDLFPPLAALAAAIPGVSVVQGVHRLAAKESDRAATLQDVYKALGVRIEIDRERDSLVIHGGAISGGEVDAHGDHRIAMTAAIAALRAAGPVQIRGAECVAKSWPGFFKVLSLVKE